MQDFACTDPEQMHYKQLAERARYFKEDEKGVAVMCKMMEDMRKEAANEAIFNERRQLAIDAIKEGVLSHEQIAKYFKLTLEEVEGLVARIEE